MHGAVLLDEKEEVLRTALIWCDQRTAEECRVLNETVGEQRLVELTSNPALPNFTLTKLMWVRTHEPEIWKRFRSFLLPKDYVRLQLTGVRAIDVSDASGTLLLDVAHRRWSMEMVKATELDERCLPEVFESSEEPHNRSDQSNSLDNLYGFFMCAPLSLSKDGPEEKALFAACAGCNCFIDCRGRFFCLVWAPPPFRTQPLRSPSSVIHELLHRSQTCGVPRQAGNYEDELSHVTASNLRAGRR